MGQYCGRHNNNDLQHKVHWKQSLYQEVKLQKKLRGWNLKEEYKSPPVLFINNLGAIDLIYNHKFHKKSKHIDI